MPPWPAIRWPFKPVWTITPAGIPYCLSKQPLEVKSAGFNLPGTCLH
jgi:hypothetical protein